MKLQSIQELTISLIIRLPLVMFLLENNATYDRSINTHRFDRWWSREEFGFSIARVEYGATFWEAGLLPASQPGRIVRIVNSTKCSEQVTMFFCLSVMYDRKKSIQRRYCMIFNDGRSCAKVAMMFLWDNHVLGPVKFVSLFT